LVQLDWKKPGMNGIAAAKAINEASPPRLPPTLFWSPHMDGYLAKPMMRWIQHPN